MALAHGWSWHCAVSSGWAVWQHPEGPCIFQQQQAWPCLRAAWHWLQNIVDSGATDPECFLWASQLRFYWQEDVSDCRIKICDASAWARAAVIVAGL